MLDLGAVPILCNAGPVPLGGHQRRPVRKSFPVAEAMTAHRALPASADGLAPFASLAAASRGRLLPERPSATRTPFQRDRDRILHSTAFRRLAQKTQVFLPEENDDFRTRLTHTMEVAQIARTIARVLGLDEDLTEALALAHDLGHPPFGHTGEEALDACLGQDGGFDHNAQSLRIVVTLERRYPSFDGLNLSWETLEGLVKHNGPLADPGGATLPADVVEIAARLDLPLALQGGAEAQAAAVADDIAYNAHDVEDGLSAGLFAPEALDALPLLADIRRTIATQYPGLDPYRTHRELTRRTIGWFVEDVLATARARIDRLQPTSADAVRALRQPLIALSDAGLAVSLAIKAFLFAHMYRHPRIVRIREQAKTIVTDLVRHYLADPARLDRADPLPPPLDCRSSSPARRVADHIAGLTDRGAVREHRRLFSTTPDLR